MQSRIDVLIQFLSVIALALPALMILVDALGIIRDDTSSDVELKFSRHALFSFFLLLIDLILISIYLLLNMLSIHICFLPACDEISFGFSVGLFVISFIPITYAVADFLRMKGYFSGLIG